MFKVNIEQTQERVNMINTYTTLPLTIEAQPDLEIDKLLAELSPDTPWFERQTAAIKLGRMRCPEALPTLVAALSVDPFWMVRCSIIQALEMIGDPVAIPILLEVAESDGFQAVRTSAEQAVKKLS